MMRERDRGSGMKLIARIALVPVGLAVAVVAFIHAAAETRPGGTVGSLRSTLNANELTVLVDEGFSMEMNDQATGGEGQLPQLSESLITLARQAYAVDPLEVSTLRTIALGDILHDDEERARQVMRLASRISKRDDVTNLWLAQDYGRTGNMMAMTASFDYALRTSARAREFAMKPVVEMLASEESYTPLGELLKPAPAWEADFWREFAGNPVSMANAAAFFAGTAIPVERMPVEDRRRLYRSLKANGQFDTLARLAALDPEAQAGAEDLAAGKFVTAEGGNPLGWTMHSRGTFAASARRETGMLEIDARAGSFGIAADRIVQVDGSHRLTIRMAEAVPESAAVRLTANCVGAEEQTLASILLEPGDRGGVAELLADYCDIANLELSFTVDEGRQAALIRIASITFGPA